MWRADDKLGSSLFLLLCIYFFSSASTALTALMNTSFYVLMMVWAVWFFKVRPFASFKSKTAALFILLCIVFFISTVVNHDYFSNNINEFKKDYLKPLFVFLVACTFIRGEQQIKTVLLCFAGGFALRTVLLLTYYGLDVAWLAQYRRGYALDAVFYCSLTSVLVIFGKNFISEKNRGLLSVALLLEVIALLIHGSRSPLFAIVFGLICVAIVNRFWRFLSVFVIASILTSVLLFSVKPTLFNRYASTFNSTTYQNDSGIVSRQGIWIATRFLIKQRPVFGYGPGWRKLALLAQENAVMAELKDEHDPRKKSGYYYFTKKAKTYGKANPHSLYLQIMLEVGFVGFFVYFGFLVGVLINAYRCIVDGNNKLIANCLVAVVPAFLVVGFANGLWANDILLMMLAGVVCNGKYLSLVASDKKEAIS